MSSSDPDARIAKMKDGRTHLAHKAEHAVGLSSGAVVAVTLQAADLGDTTTIEYTLEQAQAHAEMINGRAVEEVVADKGYHSGPVLRDLHAAGVRRVPVAATKILRPGAASAMVRVRALISS